MTDVGTERPPVRRERGRIPGPAGRSAPRPVDPPSVFSDGVELARLLARAQLTLAQALELSANVAAEAVRRSAPDTGGSGGDQVIGRVVIGADGRVVPGPAAAAGTGGGAPADRATAGALLADIAAAVRPRARRAGPDGERQLAELDRAVAELPVAGVATAARMLRGAAAAIDRRATRAELGALVRAIGPDAGPGSRAEVGAPATAAPVAPPRRAGRGPGGARRRAGAWLLSVLALAAVVLVESVLLRGHIATDVGLLLNAGRSGAAPAAASKPAARSIPAPAPAAAGSVTSVDLRPLASCTPGAPCTVRVLVRLAPAAQPQQVTWSYRVVDRCTGAASSTAGGAVAVPAGDEQAAAVGTVRLPAAQAVAVFAVTRLPAAAASPPMSVGSCPPDRGSE